jgi:acyl carrier protein
MKETEFIKQLALILEVKPKDIVKNKTLESYDFDSLRVLELMSFNDQFFEELNISADQIQDCVKISDLLKIYGSKIK